MNARFARTGFDALLVALAALPAFAAGGPAPPIEPADPAAPRPIRRHAGCLGGCIGKGRDR